MWVFLEGWLSLWDSVDFSWESVGFFDELKPCKICYSLLLELSFTREADVALVPDDDETPRFSLTFSYFFYPRTPLPFLTIVAKVFLVASYLEGVSTSGLVVAPTELEATFLVVVWSWLFYSRPRFLIDTVAVASTWEPLLTVFYTVWGYSGLLLAWGIIPS